MFKYVFIPFLVFFNLTGSISASPPSVGAPNIEMEFILNQKPEKIGDIFKVSCEVTINIPEDSITRKFLWSKSGGNYAKCYFDTYPRQIATSDNSITWIKIELGNKYSYSANFKVIDTGRFSIWPIIEIGGDPHSENGNQFFTRNTIKGSFIHIGGEIEENGGELPNSATHDSDATVYEAKIPPSLYQIDLNGKKTNDQKANQPPNNNNQSKYR